MRSGITACEQFTFLLYFLL